MTEKNALGWQHTQYEGYLRLIEDRIQNVDLTWVEQFLDVVQNDLGDAKTLKIKDIGCQAFQFYKQIKKKNLPYQYVGYDLDQQYVDLGLKYFPEMMDKVHVGDVTQYEKLVETDVTVMSATLEHIDNWALLIDKILSSTKEQVLIRTFMGENTVRDLVRAEGASDFYPIWQFGFNDLMSAIGKRGWHSKVIRDEYTGSLPEYKTYGVDRVGIVRTQYILSCHPQK